METLVRGKLTENKFARDTLGQVTGGRGPQRSDGTHGAGRPTAGDQGLGTDQPGVTGTLGLDLGRAALAAGAVLVVGPRPRFP